MRPHHCGRIWASQGGLSRNKVAVGESAAGSPPTDRDLSHFGTDSPFILIAVRRWLCQRDSTRPHRAIGHLRTTKANSSRLGSRRVGLIAQRQSASFARRMPWVRIPLSPYLRPRTVPLIRVTALGYDTQTKPMHRPAQAWMGRVEHDDIPPRRVMISCVRAIQASTGPSTVSDSLHSKRVTPGTVNIHSRHIMCLDLRDGLF